MLNTINKYILVIGTFFIPIHIQFFTYSLILFALFSIPFYRNYIYNIKQSTNIKQWSFLLIFSLYYIYDIIGLIWTDNLKDGLFDLQVKLAILLIPPIILIYKQKFPIKNLLISFTTGCLVASIILIFNAIYQYIQTQQILLYSEFSIFHHTSYFSWYLNIASLIVLHITHKNLTPLKKLLLIFTFFLVSLLCLSKIGIFTSLLVITYILFLLLKNVSPQWKLPLMLSFLFISGTPIFLLSNQIKNRFTETISTMKKIKNNSSSHIKYLESNTMRFIAWNGSIEIIKNNFWKGVGTGDIKDELIKYYKKNNYQILVEKRLNSHNQFIQDFAKLGIFNLLLLCSLFIFPFIKSNNSIVRFIIIITFINCFFESMLETQSGTIFFSFIFSSLFFIKDMN